MNFLHKLSDNDLTLAQKLKGFVPDEVFDIHVHPYHPGHFAPTAFSFLRDAGILGCTEHRKALMRYMPASRIHGLYFGMPHRSADRQSLNQWVPDEVRSNGTSLSRSLKLVAPADNQEQTAEELRKGVYAGLKVYHIYSSRHDTMHASITEYAPEWMWEILHETGGVLMLHIVRQDAITDPDNQQEIRRLCRSYPRVQLILAHVARSFNYRHARNGLHMLSDIDNAMIDTSAVCESESFRAAIKLLGPKRILWGSDFGVSEVRGRCISTGSSFFWLHPEVIKENHQPATNSEMTLIGLESLLCLQEACEDSGLNASDIKDIFLHNALRVLHPDQNNIQPTRGPQLWQQARSVISGGTGLLSKRAEMFHREWPSYFSRASGCTVWDLEGRRYLDFAGGIGAVLLGYADEDVNKAVRRRMDAGTYSSLASPDEVMLAEKLLQLHPWAGKVRYARGGGEAMSVAVRIARSATGKSGIAFCGYHGWHDWYLAANLGETHALDGHLLPGLQPLGVPRALKGSSVPFRYNDPDSFLHAVDQLGDDFAAVVMEPMRSEMPKDDFVVRVADHCRKSGGVFVVDEITSGLRYGFPGALSTVGADPDIVVYAKALGNGFPFAAIIGREEIMDAADAGFISSSYWTDGTGPAAALAVLEKMQRLNVQEQLWQKGLKFQSALRDIASLFPGCKLSVGGMPVSPTLTFGLEKDSPAAKKLFSAKMQEQGILVSSVIYLMFAHEDSHTDLFLEAMKKVLGDMQQIISGGKLAAYFSGKETDMTFARLA